MADKKISELTTASEIKNGDNLELSQDTGSGLVSLKATILAIANKILKGINFASDLQTTEKTVIGAINEVAQGGGGGGSSTLDGLNDVDIDNTTLADGQALVYNGTSEKWENGQGGGGTGGHTIIDENGNSMTARAGLQFFGAVEVTDDNANNRTLVEVLGGDFYNPVIYSTEEREIGVWTDGKPLYEKTIIWTDVSTGNNTLSHGISDVDYIFITDWNFDNVLGFEGTSSNWWAMVYSCDRTNIKYNLGSSWGNSKDLRVTFQYTKSTDVAGSGSWTPQGVPTHHYSTDEQIIGTWIDGSTLYEKSYRIADIDYSTATSFKELFTIANADTIVSIVGCMTNSAHTKQYAIPYVNASSGSIKFASVIFEDTASSGNAKSFFFTSNDTWGDSSVLLTVQYTKSS